MARQTTKLIQDQTNDLLDIERRLESAKKDRDKLTRQIANARKRLESAKSDTTQSDKALNSIISEFKKFNLLSSIVIKEIDIATDTNTEFSHPDYLKALYRVANNFDVYRFRRSGAGWNTKVNVDIEFERVAGTLQDWAEGILFYRDELDVTEGDEDSNRGQKATFYWLSKVFGGSLEGKTIKGRLRGSGAIAPFWQILDSGSQPLLSDRNDGTFNPIPALPTGFVENAERKSTNLFKIYFDEQKQIYLASIQELEREIKSAELMRDEYNNEITLLRPEAKANRKIYDSFGEKKVYIDGNKLEEVVRVLLSQGNLGKVSVELSKRGSPYRIRPRVRTLEGLI